MYDDPTEYSNKPIIEPTQAAYENPYEHSGPYYGDVPPIPPPPPLHRAHRGLLIMLMGIICILVGILTGVLFAIARPATQQAVVAHILTKARGASTNVLPATTTELTPVQSGSTPTQLLLTPTAAIKLDYTAVDILNNFDVAGLRPNYVEYNETIWDWTGGTYYVSVHAVSSAVWIDDSNCTGNCSPGNLGLWVYRSSEIAQEAYMEVANDANQAELTPSTGPSTVTGVEYVHGRCLLLGAAQASLYGEVVTEYCI